MKDDKEYPIDSQLRDDVLNVLFFTKIKLSKVVIISYQSKAELAMFSFGYSFENEQNANTPFFEDNFENHSVFTSDVQTQFNAFDLFNNNNNHHQQASLRQPHTRNKVNNSSKKSLIAQLDAFDCKQSFGNLELSYNLQQQHSEPQHFQQVKNRNNAQRSKMVESIVKKFDVNENLLITQHCSTPILDDFKTKFNFNKLSKVSLKQANQSNNSVSQLTKLKQSKVFDRIPLKSNKSNNFEENSQKSKALLREQSNVREPKLTISEVSSNMVFPSTQRKLSKTLQKNSNEIKSKIKKQKQSSEKEQKNANGMKSCSMELLKLNSLNKKVYLTNISQQKQQISLKKQQNDKQIQQKVDHSNHHLSQEISIKRNNALKKNLTNNANNDLKKNKTKLYIQGKQNQEKPFLQLTNDSVLSELLEPQSSEKMKQRYEQPNSNEIDGVYGSAYRNSEKKFSFAFKKKVHQSNDEKNNEKKDNSVNEKTIQQKQKPYFNLKLIKEPTKHQSNNEYIGKKQFSNLITEQKNKREDISTGKFFKSNTNTTNFSFAMAEPSKQSELQAQNKKTPKVTKIEVKNDKQGNRKTEKLKQIESIVHHQSDVQGKQVQQQLQLNFETAKKHRIDYEHYEQSLNSLYDEIETTKKKYLTCEESYRTIYLLLSKANLILSSRFMSQTQSNELKEKKE